MKMADIEALRAAFEDQDAALRHWAAMGALMRGKAGLDALHKEVKNACFDSSSYVKIPALWTLAKHGAAEERAESMRGLVALADWNHVNVFTAMSALCALGDLGDAVKPMLDDLKKLPKKGPAPDPRYDSYVSRLLSDLTGSEAEFELDATPAPKNQGKSPQGLRRQLPKLRQTRKLRQMPRRAKSSKPLPTSTLSSDSGLATLHPRLETWVQATLAD